MSNLLDLVLRLVVMPLARLVARGAPAAIPVMAWAQEAAPMRGGGSAAVGSWYLWIVLAVAVIALVAWGMVGARSRARR